MTILLSILVIAVWVSCWVVAVKLWTINEDLSLVGAFFFLLTAPAQALIALIVLFLFCDKLNPIVFRRRK